MHGYRSQGTLRQELFAEALVFVGGFHFSCLFVFKLPHSGTRDGTGRYAELGAIIKSDFQIYRIQLKRADKMFLKSPF